MMRKWLACLATVLYFLCGAMAWAEPQVPPKPVNSIYVQDYAGVMSAETKTRINSLGSQLAAATKAQVVVVTVKSLNGAAPEEFALAILRQWGIGDPQLNNGVLMLVAVGDRMSRIEVGYGLEGALNDAKTGRIQDEYMIPYFSRGDYDRGIDNGYAALLNEVAKEYNVQLKTDARPTPRAHVQEASWWDSAPWWVKIAAAGALLLLFLFDWVFLGGAITFFLLSLLRFRGGGGGGGGYGGGSGGGGGSSRRW